MMDHDARNFFKESMRVDNHQQDFIEDYDSHNDTEEEILSYLSSSSKEKANNSEEKYRKQGKHVEKVSESGHNIKKYKAEIIRVK